MPIRYGRFVNPVPLDLEVGLGFTVRQLGDNEECLVFATSRYSGEQEQEVEVVVATPSLSRRVLGRLPGQFLPVGTIVGDRLRGKVYVAGLAGIWEFPLEGGEPSLAAGLPDLPAASLKDVQQAYGADAHWAPQKVGSPTYRWALALDENANRLFAHCGQEGALDHFVEISLDSRSIASKVRMPGFCAGIQVDAKRGMIVLPELKEGPQILDLAGNRLAALSDAPENTRRPFWDATIRPNDGAVVLADDGGLWLWQWEQQKLTQLVEDATAPTCAPNGSLFFMRSSAELWMREAGSQPRLVARALGNAGGTEFQRRRGWVMLPRLSNDGRYVLAQLTATRRTEAAEVVLHCGVVVDLTSGRVQQVEGF